MGELGCEGEIEVPKGLLTCFCRGEEPELDAGVRQSIVLEAKELLVDVSVCPVQDTCYLNWAHKIFRCGLQTG